MAKAETPEAKLARLGAVIERANARAEKIALPRKAPYTVFLLIGNEKVIVFAKVLRGGGEAPKVIYRYIFDLESGVDVSEALDLIESILIDEKVIRKTMIAGHSDKYRYDDRSIIGNIPIHWSDTDGRMERVLPIF